MFWWMFQVLKSVINGLLSILCDTTHNIYSVFSKLNLKKKFRLFFCINSYYLAHYCTFKSFGHLPKKVQESQWWRAEPKGV